MAVIANDSLVLSDVPDPDADWPALSAFALTFNGYEAWGSFEACAEAANASRRETLTDLRTCLFFEQRRWRHFGVPPDEAAMTYSRGLVAEIRERLMRKSGYHSCTAYSFTSALPLERMRAAAGAVVPWQWLSRENHSYGDYLWASTDVPTSAVRITEDSGRFVIDVEFHSDEATARDDCEALHRRVRDELLPALGAGDVQPAEYRGR